MIPCTTEKHNRVFFLSSASDTGGSYQPYPELMCSYIKDDSHNLHDLFSVSVLIKNKEAGGKGPSDT